MMKSTPLASPLAPLRSAWLRMREVVGRTARDTMVRKSALSLLDQAVLSGVNFATTILLSRATDKVEVGNYYLALQIIFFLRGVQEQVIAAPFLIYHHRKSAAEKTRYAGSSLAHECLWLALVMAVLLALSICSPHSPAPNLLFCLALAAPLFLLREFIRQITFAHLRVAEVLILDVGVGTFQLALLGLAWRYQWLGWQSTYAILGAGCALACLAWFSTRRSEFAPDSALFWRDWRENWKFGRWALATQLLGCSMPYVLPWIVATSHGPTEAASLGVGTTLIGFANMFVLGMSNFVCPQAAKAFARDGKPELVRVLTLAGAAYSFILGSFALGMFWRGAWFLECVYGPQFGDAGPVLALLACGAWANSLGILAGNGLWAMERPAANLRADVCACVVWIIAAWLWIGPYGAWGAASASVLGTAVAAVVRLLILRHELARATKA